jgi:hypothetical protein
MKEKINKMSHLKMTAMIKGDANDQDKEDEEPRPPHPRVHQAIQRDHLFVSITRLFPLLSHIG